MRFVCLVLLLVALVFLSESEAWRRRRWRIRFRGRRFIRKIGRVAKRWAAGKIKDWAIKKGVAIVAAGRDVRDIDVNNDGTVDQSEAENLTHEEREARELLSLLDENEDSIVSLEEFERGVREISQLEDDEFMDLSQENTV